MDLIYSDNNGVDIGVMQRYYFDLEESTKAGGNTFSIETALKRNVLKLGYYLHIEGTAYGGRIDSVKVDTKNQVIYHSGKTWRGILEGKIIEPDAGADYYVVSGEANEILQQIITKIGLSAFFVAETNLSGLNIARYQFARYIDAYSGIIDMLSRIGAKLKLEWQRGKVVVSAVPIVDYSNEGEISSDLFDFVIEQCTGVPNHMIGLGRGELVERQVVHKFIDEKGEISDKQYYFGMDEISRTFDYPNCESLSELEESTAEELRSASISAKVKITANNLTADIGDKFTATDVYSGITVTQYVINKIVTIENDKIKTNYKVGDTI